jgi:hypothetical protein
MLQYSHIGEAPAPLALVEAQSGDEMMLGFKSDLDFVE